MPQSSPFVLPATTRPGAARPFCSYYPHHLPDRHSNILSYLKLGLFEWGEILKEKKKKIRVRFQVSHRSLVLQTALAGRCRDEGAKITGREREGCPGCPQERAVLSWIAVYVLSSLNKCYPGEWSVFVIRWDSPAALKMFFFDSAAPLMGWWASLLKGWYLVKSLSA